MRYILFLSLWCLAAAGCGATQSAAGGAQPKASAAAVNALAGELTAAAPGQRKICPVCHRQFDAAVKTCPYDSVALDSAKK